MSTLVLGDEPDRLELKLTRGDGFFQEVELSEDGEPVAWPPGTSAWLVVRSRGALQSGQQWQAAIAGALMTFDVDPDQVDLVGNSATARLVLQYGEATPFTAWRGDVSWS